MSDVLCHGTVHPTFAGVEQAFRENLASLDVGAGVAVSVDGNMVVDLWGGYADEARTRRWEEDTIVLVASATKSFAAACVLKLVSEGMVDLDAPVTRYWPEFGKQGKQDISIRWLLTHREGLPAITSENFIYEDYFDWDRMVRHLENQAPLWPPGSRHGYHPVTSGYLWGEIVRRVTGRSLGTYLRQEICEPWGLDFQIGLPDDELCRRAEVIASKPEHGATPEFEELMARAADQGSLTSVVFNMRDVPKNIINHPRQYTCEMPAANGCGTARALCRFYDIVDQVLAPDVLAEATREHVFGNDACIGVTSRFGLGFMLRHDLYPIGPSSRAFGHPGAGGNLGFRDPEARLSFGYVMNQGKASIFGSGTAYHLVNAVYDCLPG